MFSSLAEPQLMPVVAAGAGRIGGAADLCGAIDQAVEVEDQELAGQARIAVAGERLESDGVPRPPQVLRCMIADAERFSTWAWPMPKSSAE
ncbi:hypothetical protein G6F50_015512 [Rhizopus delemar]|uniref:Uncharacterized protein n=1 Tax=Rhizopus delemar TaxID=936053 RepID=A0A9P6XXX6_9FUNG|nr:hypothetical protein G6F50_015512 [Rhizopus delemar]